MFLLNATLLHSFNPIAIQLGPLAIRWYSLAYIIGIVVALVLSAKMRRKLNDPMLDSDEKIYDITLWIVFGIVLGGRLGYVLFYDFSAVSRDPLRMLRIWEGGMSFHGGMVGVAVGIWLYSRRIGASFLRLCDLGACTTPVGLFLGRIANFINGELYGKPTDVSWAVIFPMVDNQPRHPSQLYEALLEGVILLIIMLLCFYKTTLRRYPGSLSGVFLITYAMVRITVEAFFRVPDAQLGLFYGMLSMGEILSLPMLLLGVVVLIKAKAVR